MKAKRRKRKQGIRRCRSCGEIIRIGDEWLSDNSSLCPSCEFIDGNNPDCCERQLDADINDVLFYSDLDAFDYEMMGDDPDFDLEDYL
jgi:hypothetical protein